MKAAVLDPSPPKWRNKYKLIRDNKGHPNPANEEGRLV